MLLTSYSSSDWFVMPLGDENGNNLAVKIFQDFINDWLGFYSSEEWERKWISKLGSGVSYIFSS